MKDDRLAELLRKTDAALPPPACCGGLAERVHAAARRQRSIRLTAGAVAAAVVMIAGTYLLATWSGGLVAPSPLASADHDTTATRDAGAELDELKAQLAELRADIDTAADAIQVLRKANEQHQAGSRIETALFEPTPGERLNAEFDKTAFIMVHRGDLMYHTYGLVEPALASYRRAIELFPDSRWADIARQRLNEIENPKGDKL